MHILIAPNSFKHSLSTFALAEAIKEGIDLSRLKASCTLFPIADGGEGMTDILVPYFKGNFHHITVQDALGRDIKTSFGIINNGKTAVIELSRASGLRWLTKEELNPLKASTFGTGQLVKAALDKGIRDILIGLGNSATVDGGIGMLKALGIILKKADGTTIKPGAEEIYLIAEIDISGLDPRLKECTISVACDVENTLLGELGAARIFGPQKGADAATVELLEEYLTHFNYLTKKYTGHELAPVKHGGAAGGTAAALAVYLNAHLVSGAAHIANLTGITAALENTDLLITAEGGLDAQTLGGKAPYAIAQLAQQRNIPVIALVGQIPVNLSTKDFTYFNAIIPIANGPGNLENAIENTYLNLVRTAEQLGNILALK